MKTVCGRSEILFEEARPQQWNFPLSFSKDHLVERNAQFLPNDILTLKCEFVFSTGVEYKGIEDTEYDALSLVTENLPKIPCALEELTQLYEEGTLCDTKLKTATETFNAHKSILSARTSVFKAMFTTNMQEKANECVIIEDLDSDTIRRMLKFLYSDNLDDLDWQCAKNLYFAADKYNMIGLKHRCSAFMKSNLQPPNCCKILVLADKHQDSDLKKSVQEYIAKFREEIFRSDHWKILEKSNPELSL
ncbi:unnamed protein product [Larinioides sclopetarius]|uniref:BTB domain-containing protein n=1 Tax=Larinioides sclopetarius TaxID=280406 RepID=A0AAV2AUI7_9ARAC